MAAPSNDGLLEWFNVIIAGASALAGGIGGVVAGIWRMAQVEPRLENKMREKFEAHDRASAARTDALVDQFREAFTGIRRQIDDHRLRTEQEFLRKDDFRDFRDEYREDIKEIKDSIREIVKKA